MYNFQSFMRFYVFSSFKPRFHTDTPFFLFFLELFLSEIGAIITAAAACYWIILLEFSKADCGITFMNSVWTKILSSKAIFKKKCWTEVNKRVETCEYVKMCLLSFFVFFLPVSVFFHLQYDKIDTIIFCTYINPQKTISLSVTYV